eukprot:146117-Hanusia_phi.AAC.1
MIEEVGWGGMRGWGRLEGQKFQMNMGCKFILGAEQDGGGVVIARKRGTVVKDRVGVELRSLPEPKDGLSVPVLIDLHPTIKSLHVLPFDLYEIPPHPGI